MKYLLYKAWLLLLKSLIYVKRGVVVILGVLWLMFRKIYNWYNKYLGFYVYKFFFLIKKRLAKYKIPLDSRIVELLGRRSTLQVVLLGIVLVIMIPQSKLYGQDIAVIPGRETLLYSLVGPGDYDFDEEEIIVEQADFSQTAKIDNPAWKQGAVASDAPGNVGREVVPEIQELSSVSAGGTALTKPTILPGTDLPQVDVSQPTARKRTALVLHVVEPGDVIGAIAETYDVSVNTILWANGLTSRSYIRPGDELKILQGTGLLHEVVRGDTVGKIANKYDAETADIVEANRLQKDGADIVVGEELFIPNGSRPAPRVRQYVTRPRSISRVVAPSPSVQTPAGSGYIWPTNVRRITQYYGWRHTGLDVGGPVGSPLYASRAGTVIRSQCGWNGGYGCYVIVDHGGGVTTLYAHASQLNVSVGQGVSQGQVIALMGSTGRSTGPHIHFEVRVNGRRQNPLAYIR